MTFTMEDIIIHYTSYYALANRHVKSTNKSMILNIYKLIKTIIRFGKIHYHENYYKHIKLHIILSKKPYHLL
jgi:hypothetical protein